MTAADGAVDFYSNVNNNARYESREEAVELDKKLINAWVGHPHFTIIQNNGISFQEKIDQCKNAVLTFIGLPAPSAIVKKFRLIADKEHHEIKVPKTIKKEFFQLDETFLVTTIEGATSMVRKVGKNDSFIYSNEVRYVQNGEKI